MAVFTYIATAIVTALEIGAAYAAFATSVIATGIAMVTSRIINGPGARGGGGVRDCGGAPAVEAPLRHLARGEQARHRGLAQAQPRARFWARREGAVAGTQATQAAGRAAILGGQEPAEAAGLGGDCEWGAPGAVGVTREGVRAGTVARGEGRVSG